MKNGVNYTLRLTERCDYNSSKSINNLLTNLSSILYVDKLVKLCIRCESNKLTELDQSRVG